MIALFALLLAALPDANLSLLRPASGSDGLLGVEGARPPSDPSEPLQLQIGLDYGYNPVRIGVGGLTHNSRSGGWVQLAAPLNGYASIFAQLPVTLGQGAEIPAIFPGPNPAFGFTVGDARIGLRHGFLRGDFDLAGQVALELNTAATQSLTGDGRLVGEALLAATRRRGQWEVLGNLFARFRPPRDVSGVKLGNEIGARGGLAYWLSTRSRVYGELEVQSSLRAFAQESMPAEWRAGATLCPTSAFALDLGAGTRLDDGLGAPTFRGVVAIRYAPSFCRPPKQQTADPSVKELVARIARERAEREKAESRARMQDLLPRSEQDARENLARSEARVLLPPSEKKGVERAETFAEEDNRDSDGDGVPDRIDNCPHEKGPADNHGCPRVDKQIVAMGEDQIRILEKVYFATGKSRVHQRSSRLINQIARVLKTHPEIIQLEVAGHTDSVGGAAMNQALSQSRSEAVTTALVSRGVARNRLVAHGYGLTKPVATNDSAAGREKNRRVEFHVLKRRIAGEVVDVEQ